MAYDLILFDLDDTLYPERDYVISGLRAASQFAAKHLGLPALEQAVVTLFEEGRRGDVFQEALRLAGWECVDEALVAQLVQVYREHKPVLQLFQDVAATLPFLYGTARLGILTDGYLPPQQHKVEALGLASIMDPIIYTEALGREYWKPSQVGFARTEVACQAVAERCVYVADNPRKDFEAPNARGWMTIRVRRPHTEHADVDAGVPAQIEISDFAELRTWLEGRRSL